MAFWTQFLTDRAEPLALAIFLLDIGLTRWVFRRFAVTRVVIRILAFLVFTYFLFRARQVPYVVSAAPSGAFARLLADGLKGLWWICAAAVGADSLRAFVFRGSTQTGHKLFQDLCVAAIYLWAFVGLIVYVLNLPVQGVLVTSGAVAIVVGLALQSALSDVFHGIVLSLGKSIGPGDWISIENGVTGRVLEMNWRSAHLLSDRQDVIIVPNSVIAKSRIINSSYPSRVHGTTISVPIASSVSPASAVTALYNAALGCSKVLSSPAPAVYVKTTSMEATVVEVTFFTADFSESATVRNLVYEKIFRYLGAARIALGSTIGSPPQEAQGSAGITEIQRLVAFAPVFQLLPAEDRATIAAAMTRHSFDAGAVVVEGGTGWNALYVVGSGVLSVARHVAGQLFETERFTATDHFGGVELLQGGRESSRVSALTSAVVFRLSGADLLKLADSRPTFKDDLRQGLAAKLAMEEKAIEQWDIARAPPSSAPIWFPWHLRSPSPGVQERDNLARAEERQE